jgi:hypothetical protein
MAMATDLQRAVIQTSEASSRKDWSMCERCGGLMVTERYEDPLGLPGQYECVARRCVQCGEIVDPVILSNRRNGLGRSGHSLTGKG